MRFRLTKSEVRVLCEVGSIEEQTAFDSSFFTYRVKASNKHDNLYATIEGSVITLNIPNTLLNNWYTDDNVGFYHTQTNSNGSKLSLILEKDFVCMDEKGEDQSDNYPNPKMM